MDNRVWLARTVFYLWLALRGSDPAPRKPKVTTAQHSRPAPAVRLKPVADAK
jgi:hypothetical protein